MVVVGECGFYLVDCGEWNVVVVFCVVEQDWLCDLVGEVECVLDVVVVIGYCCIEFVGCGCVVCELVVEVVVDCGEFVVYFGVGV